MYHTFPLHLLFSLSLTLIIDIFYCLKASSCEVNWNWDKCAKILLQSSSASISQLCAPTNTIPSQQLPTQSRDKLTAIQWNANGIHPKLLELRDRLINLDIDTIAIQESKLRKADKTPLIEGSATIRKDWNNILGGGLLFFVYNDMTFEKLHSLEKAGMEILSIQVCTSKSLWIEVYNLYIPNTTTQQIHFDPNLINPSPHSIIVGDFHGHSHLWDHIQPPNTQGENITDWIINKDLHVLNDGSATRTSWITKNDSTPDLSLCGHNWSTKTSWTLAELIGNFFFYVGFLYEHSWITGLQEKEEGIWLTPHYHFHPLHRHLDISRAITAESSLLHIASSRTWSENLWFPSTSR